MADLPDHYGTLGLSPDADEVVVRAAFKALILKYHPDTSEEADATMKAVEINAAFGVLGNKTRRARYDTARRKLIAGSSLPRSEGENFGGSSSTPQPADAIRKPRSEARRFWAAVAGGVAIAIALIAYSAGRQGSPTAHAIAPSASGIASDSIPQTQSAADPIASPSTDTMPRWIAPRTNRDFTQLDFKDIEAAARALRQTVDRSGFEGARAWSEGCHAQVQSSPVWATADRCAAFDYAAHLVDARMARSARGRRNGYFQFQIDNAALGYDTLNPGVDVVQERLRRIQAAAEPAVAEAFDSSTPKKRHKAWRGRRRAHHR
jgi:curved DNA-binding protein CbpA